MKPAPITAATICAINRVRRAPTRAKSASVMPTPMAVASPLNAASTP